MAKWKSLAQKGKEVSDPWHEFRMEKECREEKAVRHLYNPRNKSWRVDEITVKMQDKVQRTGGHYRVVLRPRGDAMRAMLTANNSA